MRDYGLASYWDQRYAADEEGAFDWYQGWETLERYLKPFLSADPDFEVLIPGCGNSRLGAALGAEWRARHNGSHASDAGGSRILGRGLERLFELREGFG